jgi:hypothetical protein
VNFNNKNPAGVNNSAKLKMKNLSEKERKVIQQKIADMAYEKFQCLCDVQEFASKKLFYAILDLLEERNEPIEVALATLKYIVYTIYTDEVIDELGLEKGEF